MSVANISSSIVADVSLDFVFDENLLYIEKHDDLTIKKGKFVLGNIYGGKDKTFTIYFEPLTCAKASDIGCQVNYRDHEGKMASVWMEPKEISVVCPIIKTDQDINIGRLKDLIETLPYKDSRVYQLQSGFNVKKLATIAREVVEKHDVKHIRTLHSLDGKTCEIWYYAKTKVSKEDIIINVSILTEHNMVELFAATQTAESLTGLLAEIGRDLKQTLEAKVSGQNRVVNLTIKDSVIQRSNLLDMCSMDGSCDVNVVIEDSVVQRSNIATVNEEARRKQEQQKREEVLRRQEQQKREEALRRQEQQKHEEALRRQEQQKREEAERLRKEQEKTLVQKPVSAQLKKAAKLQILGWLFILYASSSLAVIYSTHNHWDYQYFMYTLCVIGIFMITVSEMFYSTVSSTIKKTLFYWVIEIILLVLIFGDLLFDNQIINLFIFYMAVNFLILAVVTTLVSIFKSIKKLV